MSYKSSLTFIPADIIIQISHPIPIKGTHMNATNAKLEIIVLEAKAKKISPLEYFQQFERLGLPPEVSIRLRSLSDYVVKIGGKAVSIGLIILNKLIDFIKLHPNMAVGMLLGAAIGSLVGMIPWLGPVLTPITIPLGMAIGAIAGNRMDKNINVENGSVISVSAELIGIANDFFSLFAQIFTAVKADLVMK